MTGLVAIIPVLPFLKNLKDLDPSYKMDLDFWNCFRRKKALSYIQGNTVHSARKSMELLIGGIPLDNPMVSSTILN